MMMKTENKVALYVRLSKEDTNESIDNQKKILLDYCINNNLDNYYFYIDDGWTGTNFNRPQFQKLISDIFNYKINIVIVKDLSRLGRDYIKVGEYIEHFFPLHNIRFVSINDNIDTSIDNSLNDLIPFKSIINDMYSKDLSKKIRSSIKSMQKRGLWTGGCIPFGYKKNFKDKHKLAINTKEAQIVKLIFNLAYNDYSPTMIKNYLIANNIKTINQIRKNKNSKWSLTVIKNILNNEVYIGNLVQNKHYRFSYKYRKIINNPKNLWIKNENIHPAIISHAVFKTVREKMNKKIHSNKKLFNSILYCYECKHKLSIRKGRNNKFYLCCNYYRSNLKKHVCSSHGFSYNCFIKEILTFLINNKLNIEDIKRLEISQNKEVFVFLKD